VFEMVKPFSGMEVYQERCVANFNTMPRGAAEICTRYRSFLSIIEQEDKMKRCKGLPEYVTLNIEKLSKGKSHRIA